MANLHRFQGDVTTEGGRVLPVRARYLDENFQAVRLKLSDQLRGFLQIKENFPEQDELEFVVPPPSGEAVPAFKNGVFSRWINVKLCE